MPFARKRSCADKGGCAKARRPSHNRAIVSERRRLLLRRLASADTLVARFNWRAAKVKADGRHMRRQTTNSSSSCRAEALVFARNSVGLTPKTVNFDAITQFGADRIGTKISPFGAYRIREPGSLDLIYFWLLKSIVLIRQFQATFFRVSTSVVPLLGSGTRSKACGADNHEKKVSRFS